MKPDTKSDIMETSKFTRISFFMDTDTCHSSTQQMHAVYVEDTLSPIAKNDLPSMSDSILLDEISIQLRLCVSRTTSYG
uniref:AlNc14C265G9877 protein n=1 Tax=Albugo laibachii Nc14 TaxID=890382 RepID=F0WU54_9STRA|nr:AlNc14C265G9877 [Albugo laibachii Nc14]|eukprot:CCA24931.1 AlNc14C265G9877 [Albugo laibachii Nc14]